MRTRNVVGRLGLAIVGLAMLTLSLRDPARALAPPIDPPNHFQCYDLRGRSAARTVTLEDRFTTSTVSIRRVKRLCAPASKNDEDLNAPGDADHLIGYRIERADPRFQMRHGQLVSNQFGSVSLTLVRPEMVLVPSAKSLVAPPGTYVPAIDHFQCYRVSGGRYRASGIKVQDQFGTISVDIKRPWRLCTAVDKNGEGVPDATANLLCYRVRSESRSPFRGPVFTMNQFGAGEYRVFGPRELCVPSDLGGPVPTVTATSPPTPSPTPTDVESATPTDVDTPTATPTDVDTETPTPVETATPTETATPDETATPVETGTPEETATPIETSTPDETPTPIETATETPTPTPTPTAVCGDSVIESPETCDDGNTADGDCCSSSCQTDADTTACTLPNATAAECQSGACAVVTCDPGFADCNGDPSDGCETSTDGDTNNCGACFNTCVVQNGTAACSLGQCAIDSCDPGFADCDNDPTDGCEIDTSSDPNNCGSCNGVCSVSNGTAGCSGGQCTVASCDFPFDDCNSDPTDGCEVDTDSDSQNCGSCGTDCLGGFCSVGFCGD